MATGPLQLTPFRSLSSLADHDLSRWQHEFHERHHLRLPCLLSPDLLNAIVPRVEAAAFEPASYEGVGEDLCMTPGPVIDGLHLITNDPSFLQVMSAITGAEAIGEFTGRVYRMAPAAGHVNDWHDDRQPGRQVGMSINLSPAPYEGGLFQLRSARDHSALGEWHNTGLGDAIVFRIADFLEHRVTDIAGCVPKTSFAGWFGRDRSFWQDLPRPQERSSHFSAPRHARRA